MIDSAYLATSLIAALTSLTSKSGRDAGSWLALSIGLCVLGVLRIADAGVWTDDYLRSGLIDLGWYDHRRPIQIACIASFAVALVPVLRLLSRGRPPLIVGTSAFYGLALLAAAKFSSLHWTDAVLGEEIGSVTLSHATQIVLLLVTAVAALTDWYTATKRQI